MKRTILVGLGLAFTGVFLTLAAAVLQTPHYTAHANFSINWNQMPAEDFKPQKARSKYDTMLSKFKVSDHFVSMLCQDCNIPSTEFASTAENLHRILSIKRVGKVEGGDLYRIHFADNNQEVSRKAVLLLRTRLIAKINANAKLQWSKQTISSYQENSSVRDKDQQSREELASLLQQQSHDYSTERQARIQQLDAQSNVSDVQKALTGFKTLISVVGLFTNPAKVQGPALVEVN